MRLLPILSVVAYGGGAIGGAIEIPVKRHAVTCAITSLLATLKYPPISKIASSFCSSYLRTTDVSTFVEVITIATTVETHLPRATATATVVQSGAATPPTHSAGQKSKRGHASTPAFCSGYGASAISSACSCLITRAPVSTAVVTSTKYISVRTVRTIQSTITVTTKVVPVSTTSKTISSCTSTIPPPQTASPMCQVGYQALQNPGFEAETTCPRGYRGWDITTIFSDVPSFFDAAFSYKGRVSVGTRSTVEGDVGIFFSQMLYNLCPGATYTFSMYTGVDKGPSSKVNSARKVQASTRPAIGPDPLGQGQYDICPNGPCAVNQRVEYQHTTASYTADSAFGWFQLSVYLDRGPEWADGAALFDEVTLTLVDLPGATR